MPKYDVYIHPVVRLRFTGIDADSPAEAARKAEELADLGNRNFGEAGYADDIRGFFVEAVAGPDVAAEHSVVLNRDYVEQTATDRDSRLACREVLQEALNMSDPDHPGFADSCADVVQYLWEHERLILSTERIDVNQHANTETHDEM